LGLWFELPGELQLGWTASLHRNSPERKYVSLSRLTRALGKVSLERLTYKKSQAGKADVQKSQLGKVDVQFKVSG